MTFIESRPKSDMNSVSSERLCPSGVYGPKISLELGKYRLVVAHRAGGREGDPFIRGYLSCRTFLGATTASLSIMDAAVL